MLTVSSIVNRTAAVHLPLIGVTASFLTFTIALKLPSGESLETAFFIARDTYLWVAIIVGILLLSADLLLPRGRKLILGFSITSAVLVAAFGWMIAESLMHT